jgi:hypothetical protein
VKAIEMNYRALVDGPFGGDASPSRAEPTGQASQREIGHLT